jgi:ATP-binding protein involved in chromosome partitioning
VITREHIEDVLSKVQDPHLQQDLVSAKMVRDVNIDGGRVQLQLEMGYPANGYHEKMTDIIKSKLGSLDGIADIDIIIDTKIISHSVQKGVQLIPNIKNIIAIASGKGGVGKSTTAINLALALQKEGANVGILDADIYGPSQPRMLGCRGKPESIDGKTMEPMVSYGMQSMSIGYLIEEDNPMIWRGPMVTSALEQLLGDTNWTDLDYLVVDLPPGTGDIQLTLCQKIPVSGAIIVTTPQDIALLDAKKGLKMFHTVDVPVLGIIENMSTYICNQCGHEDHIFGEGGGEQMAEQYDIDLLGSLPLDTKIREGVDNGRPTVSMDPDSRAALSYRDIARRAAAKLALQAKDYSSAFPRIVIDNK